MILKCFYLLLPWSSIDFVSFSKAFSKGEVNLTVCYYHVTYGLPECQGTACLKQVPYLLSDSKIIWTHNHIVCKWTLNHLAKMVKWLWVWIVLLSLRSKPSLLYDSSFISSSISPVRYSYLSNFPDDKMILLLVFC